MRIRHTPEYRAAMKRLLKVRTDRRTHKEGLKKIAWAAAEKALEERTEEQIVVIAEPVKEKEE